MSDYDGVNILNPSHSTSQMNIWLERLQKEADNEKAQFNNKWQTDSFPSADKPHII